MKLEIGNTIYDLEYKVNSVCDLEDLTGKQIGEVLAMPNYSMFRSMLWCGLITHHKITIGQAGDLVEEYLRNHSQIELSKVLGQAIEDAGFMAAQGKPKK